MLTKLTADYGGISASRLEVLEERLRDDVVAEVGSFGGRLLLHTETPDGSVIPVWEEVGLEDVSVLKDVMSSRKHLKGGVELSYVRIPITAERPPDFSDLTEMIEVALRNPNTPIVVNCQLGRGRSTMAAVSDFAGIWACVTLNLVIDHLGFNQQVARTVCEANCAVDTSSHAFGDCNFYYRRRRQPQERSSLLSDY